MWVALFKYPGADGPREHLQGAFAPGYPKLTVHDRREYSVLYLFISRLSLLVLCKNECHHYVEDGIHGAGGKPLHWLHVLDYV